MVAARSVGVRRHSSEKVGGADGCRAAGGPGDVDDEHLDGGQAAHLVVEGVGQPGGLSRLNSLSARASATPRRRRMAMCPSAQARWVLPTPTGPSSRAPCARPGTAARRARSRAAGRSGRRWPGPRCPVACPRRARRPGPAGRRTWPRGGRSSARTSSEEVGVGHVLLAGQGERSGRVWSIWPSLSARNVARRSGLTASRMVAVTGCLPLRRR